MLDRLNRESFEPYLNQPFDLELETGQKVGVTLVEIKGLPDYPRPRLPGLPEIPQRKPFSLLFRGPAQPALPQHMYNLRNIEMGLIEGMFLVPIAGNAQERFYEAIFN